MRQHAQSYQILCSSRASRGAGGDHGAQKRGGEGVAGEGERDAPDGFSLKLALAEKGREALGRFTGLGRGYLQGLLNSLPCPDQKAQGFWWLEAFESLLAISQTRRGGVQGPSWVSEGSCCSDWTPPGSFSCFFLETLNIRGWLAHQREETAPWEQRIN